MLIRTLALMGALGIAVACAAPDRDDPSCPPRPAIANHGRPATVRVGADSVTVAAFVITDSEPPYSNATYVRFTTDTTSPHPSGLALDSAFSLVCGARELVIGHLTPAPADPLFVPARDKRFDEWFHADGVPAVSWWKGSYDLRVRVYDTSGHVEVVRVAPLELLLEAFRDTTQLSDAPVRVR